MEPPCDFEAACGRPDCGGRIVKLRARDNGAAWEASTTSGDKHRSVRQQRRGMKITPCAEATGLLKSTGIPNRRLRHHQQCDENKQRSHDSPAQRLSSEPK